MSTFQERYNLSLSIRDSLSTLKSEISILSEDERVQKYLELMATYERFKHLENATDEEIFNNLVHEDKTIGENIYFCYGHNFVGRTNGIGKWYISNDYSRTYMPVSKYQNLKDEDDVVIVPFIERPEFESKHTIREALTSDPEQEYNEIRRQMYREEIKPLKM